MASMAAFCVSAQDSTSVKFSGYAEVYFGYDLSRPPTGERPDLLYNHKRHNEVDLNLGLLRAEYAQESTRAALALMAGSYAQYNLAAEPPALRHIHEARVGFRLSRTRDLWVDAGILPSHIGSESAVGLECLTLTRSLVAENSPYFEAGAMLSYRPNERWLMAALLLNGWQRIRRAPGEQRPAFGTQLKYDSGLGSVFNWSTFVGSMGPDSVGVWRFYNNLYAQVDGENSGMVVGADVGLQHVRDPVSDAVDTGGWMTLVAIYSRRVIRQWWAVGRSEYFLDDDGFVTSGFTALGASLGVDLRINEQASWRLEGRFFGAPDGQFLDVNLAPSRTNMAITTALCVKF
ncbi:MAG: porin [Flavobacteriales bacterium]